MSSIMNEEADTYLLASSLFIAKLEKTNKYTNPAYIYKYTNPARHTLMRLFDALSPISDHFRRPFLGKHHSQSAILPRILAQFLIWWSFVPKMGVESGRKSAIGRRKDASTYAWLTHW